MADTQVAPAVIVDVEQGVGNIRLNRPDASNAMSLELLRGLHEAALACDSNPEVKVILLTGEGRNFCGGGHARGFPPPRAHPPWPLRHLPAPRHGAAPAPLLPPPL